MAEQRESAIAVELQRLAHEHGGVLQPRVVVDAARSPESPLHKSFEWDDTEAAEQWRLQQARKLINVVVRYEQVGAKSISCRVFVSLTPDRKEGGDGYRLSATVMSDSDQRRQLLADARADMLRFKEKYRALNELAEVFDAIDRAAESELAATA